MAGKRQAKQDQSNAVGARVLVVAARFYEEISDLLLAGANRALEEAQAEVALINVPGALEIPTAIAIALDAAARRRQPYAGAVALGCVIRGETIHFEVVSHQSAHGLLALSLARGLPIGNGIITVENEAQAFARARILEQDKGGDAARAALSLIALKRSLAGRSRQRRTLTRT